MTSMTAEERALFPLRTVKSVVELFRSMLTRSDQPDLSLMSIVAGLVENTLTCHHQLPILAARVTPPDDPGDAKPLLVQPQAKGGDLLPEVELDVIEALHAKFRAVIKSSIDTHHCGKPPRAATRELIKKVSDVIWNTLTRSYYKDRAHLQSLYSYLTGNKLDCFGVAMAVVAGCQVLGFDDVHLALSEDHAWVVFGPDGQETAEVTWHGKGNEDKRGQPVDSGIQARSWLYVAGKPVVCSRFTEVAALVSSINPSVTATTDSAEVAQLQQSLLWVLYDMGHLDRYPMALGNLADLEEQSPTPGRIHCSQLFGQAIEVARRMYGNAHVYPYTYQGGYYYRNRLYKEALESWANAADAIRSYNYSREDEEIYKEFLEIANELIPFVMKVEGSGISARSILKDSECFAHLLRFYDGICQWEEGSCTPVLHIGWAKPLVNTISKFDAQVRRHVDIHCSADEELTATGTKDGLQQQQHHTEGLTTISTSEGGRTELDANANRVLRPADEGGTSRDVKEEDENSSSSTTSSSSAAARLGTTALAALTDLCGRQLLSPAFFLGPSSSSPLNVSGESGGQHAVSEAGQQPDKAVLPASKPRLYLRSHKMAGLKDLLMSEKLNTHAISLQLTAQSQVQLGGRAKNNAARAEAAAADALNNPAATGSPAPNNNKDGADSGKHPDAAQSVPSRPKRTRKE